MPDYLRLIALFGIVVVNVQFMAYSSLEGFFAATVAGPVDAGAVWLVDGLAATKTYGLFSFMFGVGLAYQMRAAEKRGLPFAKLYRNRMLGLILLGLLHGCLFFPYDILLVYGLAGTLLYWLRNSTVARLVRIGAVLLVMQALLFAALFLVPEPPADVGEIEQTVLTQGGWSDVITFRAITFANVFPILLVVQGLSALGWFCLGLAAVRSGVIDTPGHPVWARARRWCLGPGVGLSLLGAGLWHWGPEDVGKILVSAAAPIATLGYLGGIAAIARAPSRVMARLLNAGGSSLSVYLGQSIVLTTIFSPYGLGLWDAVGPAAAVGIAIAVTVGLILLLALWRVRFALGPFEWVLRRITRLGVRPAAAQPSQSRG